MQQKKRSFKIILVYIASITLLLLKQVLLATTPLILNIMIDASVLGKEIKNSYLLTLINMVTKVEKGMHSIIVLSIIILRLVILADVTSDISYIFTALSTENITKFNNCE